MELLLVIIIVISNILFVILTYDVRRQNYELEQKLNKLTKATCTRVVKLFDKIKLIDFDIVKLKNKTDLVDNVNKKNTLELTDSLEKINLQIDMIADKLNYLLCKNEPVYKQIGNPIWPNNNMTNSKVIRIDSIEFNNLRNINKIKYN